MQTLLEVKDLTIGFLQKQHKNKKREEMREKEKKKKEEKERINLVVEHLSFTVKKGEILGIVGESGSGKSMTALAIMGLLSKEAIVLSGELLFDISKKLNLLEQKEQKNIQNQKMEEKGSKKENKQENKQDNLVSQKNLMQDILCMSEKQQRLLKGEEIAMIFQEPMTSLNPVITIGKQIEEMVWLHRKATKEELYKQTIDIMKEVGLKDTEQLYQKYPHQLSGGMRQRVMIAMAMILKPKLLIADEPTTALDVTIQAQILTLLQKLNQEYGVSVILISHDLGIIKSVCNRAIVLYDGKIVEMGHVHQLFYHPKEDYTKKLLEAVPRREKTNQFLESKIQNQEKLEQAEVILSVNHWNSFYKEYTNGFLRQGKKRFVLQDVSFELHRGEILGIVGESGSGKSTLAKSLVGLIKDTQGEFFIKKKKPRMVFQDPYSSLNPAKTVEWILEEPMKIQGGFTKEERQKRVKEIIQQVGLKEKYLTRSIAQLSGGQRQRISIACALVLNPEILILDEPVSALDVTVQAQILKLLLELREKYDLSYIFISHDLNVIYQMCDRVAVLYQGKIVEQATGKELYEKPQHEYTKKLLKAIPNI